MQDKDDAAAAQAQQCDAAKGQLQQQVQEKDAAAAAFDDAKREAARTGREAVVLLSPACASFDQFPDFEVRGEAFRTAVLGLIG